MTKAEYLVKLLEILPKKVLPIQNDLLYLIEHKTISNELIDIFYDMFQEIAKTAKTRESKEIIQKGLIFLKKIKNLEADDKIKDQKDLKILGDLINNL